MGLFGNLFTREQSNSEDSAVTPMPPTPRPPGRLAEPGGGLIPNPTPMLSTNQKGLEGEDRVRRLFRDLGVPIIRGVPDFDGFPVGAVLLNDLTLIDSKGRTSQIDHILLCGETVLTIETKNLSGWLFGKEGAAKWTQTFPGGKKFSMSNPLRQAKGHAALIRALLDEDITVIPVVALAGEAELKTDAGENVLSLDQLSRFVRHLLNQDSASSSCEGAARTICVQLASEDEAARHIESLQKRHKPEPEPQEPAPNPTETTRTDSEVEQKLKDWRRGQAEISNVLPYAIMTNQMLTDIVQAQPKTLDDLSQISGMGNTRMTKWGLHILMIVNDEYQPQRAKHGTTTTGEEQ